MAKGKHANGSYGFSSLNRSYAALTDGRNFYGEILPLRQWLGELALRHELELERPQLPAPPAMAVRGTKKPTQPPDRFGGALARQWSSPWL